MKSPTANCLQTVAVSAITKHFVLWSASDLGLLLDPGLAQIHRNDGLIPTVLCALEKIPYRRQNLLDPLDPAQRFFLFINFLFPEQEAGQAHTAAGPAATSSRLRVNLVRQPYVESRG